jgi:hypothetical protein
MGSLHINKFEKKAHAYQDVFIQGKSISDLVILEKILYQN